MQHNKRKYELADSEKRDTDLTAYRSIIIRTINQAVPGKHPEVFSDYFTTDELTHSEAVRIGRALSRVEELSYLGKEVKQFRLFEGKPFIEKKKRSGNYKLTRGGRMA